LREYINLHKVNFTIDLEIKVFITGSTGFLGKYVSRHFSNAGYGIISPSRNDLMIELVDNRNIDILIHSAGKAHSASTNKEETKAFFDVNYELTKKITATINQNKIEVNTFVFISTVSVYGLEEGFEVNEDVPLNGNSAYAQSKKMAEEHLQKWAKESGVNLIILRLPLIFGENAPGNLGAMERAVKGRYYFQIGRGEAKRSMVHAKQLAEFLPTLMGKSGIYHLTDGEHNSYNEVAEYFAKKYKRRIINVPLLPFKIIARVGDLIPKFPLTSYRLDKLSQSLTFSDQKARRELGWKGTNALEI
jgi:nucleoside-diphosphate-sugar epimerase